MSTELAAVGFALGLWLLVFSIVKPRLLLYVIFGTVPLQFIFVPVSTYFVSPADAFVVLAAIGFVVRCAAGRRAAGALYRHRWALLLIGAYLFGFLVLGVFSRTIARLFLAMIPSMLACEVLLTRRHMARAATALVIAGIVEGSYGLVMYAVGTPLHPTRFAGMSGVNFTAVILFAAAGILFAKYGRRRPWRVLARPAVVSIFGLATLSQAGVLAFITSWLLVLRRVMTRRNVVRVTAVVVVAAAMSLASAPVRAVLASRNERQMTSDGVMRNSADVRRMILRVTWRAFVESPVVGVGFSQFMRYSTTDPEIARSTHGAGYGTHNTYVEVLVEGGVLAFFCFLMHFRQFLLALRTISTKAGAVDAEAGPALVALPVVLVGALFSNALLLYHFWAVCGLALAYLGLRVRESRAGVLR